MNPGLFNKRITLLQAQSVEDDLGQKDVQWIPYKDVWAMIKTVKGSEYINAGAEQAQITSRFVIRYQPGITSDMRINFNGRIFDIIEPPINDDEANKTLTILARESVYNG